MDADELAASHGYENLGQVGQLEHYYVFQELPKHLHRRDVIRDRHIGQHDAVKWWETQRARLLAKRSIIPTRDDYNNASFLHHHNEKRKAYVVKDPQYANQWHLHGKMSINCIPVWNAGGFGEGITVSIIDDG